MHPPSTLRSWYEAGDHSLLARLTAAGFMAGLASWLLLYGLHLVTGTPRPSIAELVLAGALGALFGATLAFILGKYWDRHSVSRGHSPRAGRPPHRRA